MSYRINRAMVVGSGVMGAGIAAHLVNAGVPVYLMDIVPSHLTAEEEKKGLTLASPQVRNRMAEQGIASLKKSRPPGLFSDSRLERITAGNTEDNLDWASQAEWIVEVVVENLEIKRRVMAQIEASRKAGSIISTNTSGIPVRHIAEGRSEEFRRHFLGVHFFNPARYMKLLELIPTADTDPRVLEFMRSFGERRLGKTVVICRDTPNFIANRVAVMAGRADLNHILEKGYSVEEIDAVTGPLIGHPKTATFRLLDLIGTDINQHVSGNLYKAIPHDAFREVLLGPSNTLTDQMVEKGLLGNKAGQGFYKKVKGPDGSKTYQVLDLPTLTYRNPREPDLASVKRAEKIKPLAERFRFLVTQQDPVGLFLWRSAAFAFSYCSHLVPEISEVFYAIDEAMKAGFSHEMGPFELWDALGVAETLTRMEADGFEAAPWVKEMIRQGGERFYKQDLNRKLYWDIEAGAYRPVPADPHRFVLRDRKKQGGIIQENPGASLIDLGDEVLCLEFHSKANILDDHVEALCDHALDILEKKSIGMVIGNQGRNFCGGADIARILPLLEGKAWSEIEGALRKMQDRMLRLRYSPKPVVAAPFGMTLGGGTEIAMACDKICAGAETYMGLVEVAVGLIPASGGCLEMIRRCVSPAMRIADTDALPFVQKAFENLALAKVSQSALHAKELGFLTEKDRWIMNGDHVLHEAKNLVLEMQAAGYVPPVRTKSIYAVGERGLAYLMQAARMMLWGKYITAHDNMIAGKLAYVLAGGPLSAPQWVDEQYILDLEREAVLSLLGEPKTLERIKHMLKTGKPLRN
ncbi:MAG: 3-hydroxyacyl-CoA dehydrogenase NAD-binding domain-containing protein [Candidatus Desulfacyla sp.]